MPVKRTRTFRSQHALDEHRLQQLLEGPDALLLAGCGYFAVPLASGTRGMTAAQYDEMLSAMRADWQRHRVELLAAWREAGHEPGTMP